MTKQALTDFFSFWNLNVEMFWLMIRSIGFIIWLICNLAMYGLTIMIIRKIGNELFIANQLVEDEIPSK